MKKKIISDHKASQSLLFHLGRLFHLSPPKKTQVFDWDRFCVDDVYCIEYCENLGLKVKKVEL